jgi:hypothetical protein
MIVSYCQRESDQESISTDSFHKLYEGTYFYHFLIFSAQIFNINSVVLDVVFHILTTANIGQRENHFRREKKYIMK